MTVIDNGVLVNIAIGRLPPAVIGRLTIDVPHLVDTEFLHVLRRQNRLGLVTDREAVRILGWLDNLSISRHDEGTLRGRVWQLRRNLTAYDATYVALAEALGTRLLTTDARIARAPGIRCLVDVV